MAPGSCDSCDSSSRDVLTPLNLNFAHRKHGKQAAVRPPGHNFMPYDQVSRSTHFGRFRKGTERGRAFKWLSDCLCARRGEVAAGVEEATSTNSGRTFLFGFIIVSNREWGAVLASAPFQAIRTQIKNA